MIKTITFAILHFSVAFSVAYILTGSIGVSSAVALVEPIVNTVVFISMKKRGPLEKNKSEKQKLWVPLHQCRLKFQTAFCLVKTGYGFRFVIASKCQPK